MTQRILILGAAGFVGGHLRRALKDRLGPDAEIIPTSRLGGEVGMRGLDLTDVLALEAALGALRPTHVINLVGIASPVAARHHPELAWSLHATGPEALGRLMLRLAPKAWLLHVSSGLSYGRSALSGRTLTEETPLEPMDIYGVTKAAGDLAVGALANEGLRCLRLRPFNHIGPGQTEDFVVPAFAGQLARIARGEKEPVLHVGNLDAERDFLDVRDVADAYASLVEKCDDMVPGTAFNVSSDVAVSIKRVLGLLIEASGLTVSVEPDPARLRPSEVTTIRGSARRLTEACGWRPAYTLETSLRDVLRNV